MFTKPNAKFEIDAFAQKNMQKTPQIADTKFTIVSHAGLLDSEGFIKAVIIAYAAIAIIITAIHHS